MLPFHICYCRKALTMTSSDKHCLFFSLKEKKVRLPCNNQPKAIRKHIRALTLAHRLIALSSFLQCERVAHVL